MKILLDECVPKPIKYSLSVEGHECSTVPDAGFSGRTNGELLTLAESKFEVFVTLDKSEALGIWLPVSTTTSRADSDHRH